MCSGNRRARENRASKGRPKGVAPAIREPKRKAPSRRTAIRNGTGLGQPRCTRTCFISSPDLLLSPPRPTGVHSPFPARLRLVPPPPSPPTFHHPPQRAHHAIFRLLASCPRRGRLAHCWRSALLRPAPPHRFSAASALDSRSARLPFCAVQVEPVFRCGTARRARAAGDRCAFAPNSHLRDTWCLSSGVAR